MIIKPLVAINYLRYTYKIINNNSKQLSIGQVFYVRSVVYYAKLA